MADQRQKAAASCQGLVAGRRSWSFPWDGRSTCICHMDGWAVDQHGGRSDGALPGDGDPGTVNGGEEQDLPHGWLGRHILQPQEMQCRGKTTRSGLVMESAGWKS